MWADITNQWAVLRPVAREGRLLQNLSSPSARQSALCVIFLWGLWLSTAPSRRWTCLINWAYGDWAKSREQSFLVVVAAVAVAVAAAAVAAAAAAGGGGPFFFVSMDHAGPFRGLVAQVSLPCPSLPSEAFRRGREPSLPLLPPPPTRPPPHPSLSDNRSINRGLSEDCQCFRAICWYRCQRNRCITVAD